MIIDGLDEVEPDEDLGSSGTQAAKDEIYLEILSVLLHAAKDPAFPFRIVVVSRPETSIRGFFARDSARNFTRAIFLDDKYDPDADIELFLRSKFADIRHSYGIVPSWPTDDAMQFLVKNASGQFIYADTVARYVADKTSLPQAQLDRVLKLGPPADGESNPFATLNALYTRIINSSPDPQLAMKWIGIIRRGFFEYPAFFRRQFLELEQGEAVYLLSNLSSLISTPPLHDAASPYVIYHKSLLDFFDRIPETDPLYLPWRGPDSKLHLYATRFVRVMKSTSP